MPQHLLDPKTPVRRYFEEVANGHKLELADDLFAPDFGAPGPVLEPDAARAALRKHVGRLPGPSFCDR